ncbi:MAG: helix-turn-helix transcriptional regulator [Limisphaerales bacterium]
MKQRFNLNLPNIENSCDAQPNTAPGFIDQKQLLAKLPISRRTLFNWRTTGKIPCVRLGGRRILFHWPSVEAALLRHQHGGGDF